jgi:hypothetical protein
MVADQLHINEILRLLDSQIIERRRAIAEKRYAQPQMQQYQQPQRSQSSTQLLGKESKLQQVMFFKFEGSDVQG